MTECVRLKVGDRIDFDFGGKVREAWRGYKITGCRVVIGKDQDVGNFELLCEEIVVAGMTRTEQARANAYFEGVKQTNRDYRENLTRQGKTIADDYQDCPGGNGGE